MLTFSLLRVIEGQKRVSCASLNSLQTRLFLGGESTADGLLTSNGVLTCILMLLVFFVGTQMKENSFQLKESTSQSIMFLAPVGTK
jgi:uncharacterized membrane protein YbjE (DUF340 family)